MTLHERRTVIRLILACHPAKPAQAQNTRANLDMMSDRELDTILRSLSPIKIVVQEREGKRLQFSHRLADMAVRRAARYARVAAVPSKGGKPVRVGNGNGVAAPDACVADDGAFDMTLRGRALQADGFSALSLEGIVEEELRPLLKTWLDTHLAAAIEAQVQETIASVTQK